MPVDLTKTTRRRGHYLPLLPQITRTRTATTRSTTMSAIKDFIVHLLPPHNRCWSAGSSPGARADGRMLLARRRAMGGSPMNMTWSGLSSTGGSGSRTFGIAIARSLRPRRGFAVRAPL